jgi:long-subunit acyl-CoA synthetase (AMP-forming)
LTVLFSAPILECYGTTETAGFITSTFFRDNVGGHVGGVVPCNQIQLRDTPNFSEKT